MQHKDTSQYNILFLTPWYPNINSKMSGLFIQRHSQAVSDYNNVAVLFVGSDSSLKKVFRVQITDSGLKEIKIHYKKTSGILKILMPFLFLWAHVKGIRILRKHFGFKPDLLHVNILTREGVIALLYKIVFGIKYVVTEHWTRYHAGNFNGILRILTTRIVVKNASAIMPVSLHLKKAMLNCNLNNRNYTVVPNVVDTNLFHPVLNEKTEQRINIIHISCTNDEQKNISGILHAIKKLSDIRTDFKLYIIGDAVDFPKLKQLKTELNLDAFVVFSGLLEGEELAEIIANADFHLMFSNYENLPVVNLECFASGIPVLSSDVGGIKEHLNSNLGRLVEKGNIDQLVSSINSMMDNLSTYDSMYIREYAVKNFSKESIGKQITYIYKSVLNAD